MPGSGLPLRSLAVFEAAARLGSFREAAEELALTPSAVSHQIRLLEGRLGLRLFERVGRGIVLSQEGLHFHTEVGQAFDKLRLAITSLRGRARSGSGAEVVKVATPPSFASKWLLPRLPGFLALNPAIDIRVNAQSGLGIDMSGVDLAIIYGGPGKWEAQAVPWLAETIQPLCAPALVAGELMRSPGDLMSHMLIRTRGNTLSWEDWFRRHGIGVARLRTIQLDPSHVAIEAAVRGLGFVLESDVLTQAEIASGALVAPLRGFGLTGMSYSLVTPRPSPSRASVDLVRRWLLDSAGAQPEGVV